MASDNNGDEIDSGFQVSGADASLTALVANRPRLWIRLGNTESKFLSDDLATSEIRRPIFIAGLARSGSTILLEMLASAPGVATHRYRDFPFLFTPYWWNRLVDLLPRKHGKATERAHKDRIQITPESPEAMEEALWMAFFGGLHDPTRSNVLTDADTNPAFDAFFLDHIRKILCIRGGDRYLSKGNYNVSRLGYLIRLFPDARFIVPIRAPVTHVASLKKQHALFMKVLRDNPRALKHLAHVGHFEFGPERRAVNFGDVAAVERVQTLWDAGEDARGWAAYWSLAYGHVADRLAENTRLRDATLLVRYEDLCNDSEAWIQQIAAHCELSCAEQLVNRYTDVLSLPTYYNSGFSGADLGAIDEETSETAQRFGYETGQHSKPNTPR